MKIYTPFIAVAVVIGLWLTTAFALDRAPATMVSTSTNNYLMLTGTTAQINFNELDHMNAGFSNYLEVCSNLARQAYNNSLTGALDLSGNMYVGGLIQTNIDTKVSYLGYPRLNNKAVVRSAGAGTHPATYTTLITDTNLTTFIRGTNNAGTEVTYFMDMGEVYDGVVIIVASSEDLGLGDIKFSALSSMGYPDFAGPPGAGYWTGTACPTAAGVEVGTNGIHRIVQPFNGRYVGCMIRNTDGAAGKVYKLYEMIVYGVTNAWRNW